MEAYLREDYRVVNGKNATPLLQIMSFKGRSNRFVEGSVSKDGLSLGCSMYGLFDTPSFRNNIIEFLSKKKGVSATAHEFDAMEFWDNQIQKFSDTVKDNIDMHEIRRIVGLN